MAPRNTTTINIAATTIQKCIPLQDFNTILLLLYTAIDNTTTTISTPSLPLLLLLLLLLFPL